MPSAPSKRYTAVTHPEDPSSITPAVKELLDRSHAYILPVYARPPIVMAKGKGAYLWDVQGRKYLDFSAGIAVNALGHGDEGVVEVRRFDLITHVSTSQEQVWEATTHPVGRAVPSMLMPPRPLPGSGRTQS